MITEGDGAVEPASAGALLGPYTDYHDGSGGGLAYPLDDLLPRKFASVDELAEFISLGTVDGLGYGIGGQGSGRMPGFGEDANTEEIANDGMYTREMVCAVARYAATLQGNEQPLPEVPTTAAPPPTTTTTVAGGEEAEESAPPTPAFCSDEAIEALNP
jgi:hypothetical protein